MQQDLHVATADVTLTDGDRAEAKLLAAREGRRFRDAPSPYGTNAASAHLTGKLGEVAVYRWAQRVGVRTFPLFRFQSFTRGADVTAASVPIEVKAYRAGAWERLGGCVSTYQLDSILSKASLIVFCRVPDASEPAVVQLVGWAAIRDLTRSSRPALDATFRANLRLPQQAMQSMRSLADRLADADKAEEGLAKPPGAAADPDGWCPEGHATFYGHCWGCLRLPLDAPERVTVSAAARAHMHAADPDALVASHGTWPFLTGISRPRFCNVVFRHQPCPLCFKRPPTAAADVDALSALTDEDDYATSR